MKCSSVARCWLTSCALLLTWSAVVHADNWPQWRGPANDGVCKETNLPADLSAAKNLVWKLPLPGMAGATPVIWGDRIFLTSEDGEDVVLLCVSTQGKQLWKRKLSTGKARYRGDEGNMASASPSTDGAHVFTFTGTGDFACHDFAGKEVWKFNAQERYGKFKIQHGMHVTPLLHGDRLYHCLLHSAGWWVYAVDKATGKEVWKLNRPSDAERESKEAYASPCLGRNGKDEYVIVHGSDYTTAHRLADGAEIWRLADLNPKSSYHSSLRFIASPVATADLIVIPTAKNGPVVGIKPEAQGTFKADSPFQLWRRSQNTPDVSAPLVHDGLVYLCRETGFLLCMDAGTGKELYHQRIHEGRYRASPVYADGKIFCTARDGTITVVRAGPKFEVLTVNKMGDEIAASLAISNGRVYVRGFRTLYAVGQGE